MNENDTPPPSKPAPVDAARHARRKGQGRRELRSIIESRYVVLPSNAGKPEQFTSENIDKAHKHGRAKLPPLG
jgi:hypothetical protein